MKNAAEMLLVLSLLAIPICASAQTSPAVPAKIWQAVENEILGDNSFDRIRHLTRYHAPNGSNDDFEAQAEWVAEKAREYGLADVKIIWIGGSGHPWNVRSGEAWIVEPDVVKLGDTLESPLRVATNSRSADLTAELVDVGEGTRESDFQDKDVKGKVVLASGGPRAVNALAVWKYGAAGVISYAPQRPYFPDQVAFTFLPYKSDDGKEPTFAFLLTQREGDGLHGRMAQLKQDGKTMRVRIKIETYFNEPRQGIAEGWIRGTNPKNDDIVLTAHMQEERTSANDNRSGVANLLEIARTLNKLIGEGKLDRPRRNIRFWWVDEIGAEYRNLAEQPGAAGTMLANWQVDATQLKRNAFVVGTSAFALASAGDADLIRLTALVLGGAQARLARDSEAAVSRLADDTVADLANRYKDAAMLLDTAAWRETEAVDSLRVFVESGGPGAKLIATARDRVQKLATVLRADLDAFYHQATGFRAEVVLTEEEQQAAARIPAWKVTLLDTQTEKIKMPESPGSLHWHYVFEVHHLIDGKRSVLDIFRMALSAGTWYYGPVEFADVTKHFESLEKAGAIAMQGK